jgi:predicted phage tail protein
MSQSESNLPVVYSGAGKGGGGGQSSTPIEIPENLRSTGKIKLIDVICEGEIEGLVNSDRSIYINDAPLRNNKMDYATWQTYIRNNPQNMGLDMNYTGLEWQFFTGTLTQEAIDPKKLAISDVTTEYAHSTEVMSGYTEQDVLSLVDPWGTAKLSGAITTAMRYANAVALSITNPNVDQIELRLSVPSLWETNPFLNYIGPTKVVYGVEIKSSITGDTWNPLYSSNPPMVMGRRIDNTHFVFDEYTLALTLTFTAEAYMKPIYDTEGIQVDVSMWQGAAGFIQVTYKLLADTEWLNGPLVKLTSWSGQYTAVLGDLILGKYEVKIAYVQDTIYQSDAQTLNIESLTGYGSTPNSYIDYFEGLTYSKYERAVKVVLPFRDGIPRQDHMPWSLRIYRITPDNLSTKRSNKLNLDSYTEHTLVRLRYPNTAYCAMTAHAEQFSSVPSRAYDLKLLKIKIPTNYEPTAHTYNRASNGTLVFDGNGLPVEQIWDGQFYVAWSDNPAWCFYDLLSHRRYGLGSFLDTSYINKWSLYTIGKYCDGRVPSGKLENAVAYAPATSYPAGSVAVYNNKWYRNTSNPAVTLVGVLPTNTASWTEIAVNTPIYEPRFTLNAYIASSVEAYKLLQDMSSVFRGMIYWAANSVIAVQDSPQPPVAVFSNANVIGGMFTYVGSARRARRTVALVTWNDPQNLYRKAIEYVENREAMLRYGYNSTEIIAFGCTSRGQAHRLGRWLLYSESNETEVVTFQVGADSTLIQPNNIIKVQDESRNLNRMAGRIIRATATSIITDSKLTTLALPATLDIILSDGSLFSTPIASFSHTNIVPPIDKGAWVSGTYYNAGEMATYATIQYVCISPIPIVPASNPTVDTANWMTYTAYVAQAGSPCTTLNWSGPIPSTPVPESMWLVTAAGVSNWLYRIVGIKEIDTLSYEISAVAHYPQKFDLIENNLALSVDSGTINADLTTVSPPRNITFTEEVYSPTPGTSAIRLVISWEAPENKYVYQYKGQVQHPDGSFQMFNTPDAKLTVVVASSGTYTINVRTVTFSNMVSAPATASYLLVLHSKVPVPNVTGLDLYPGNNYRYFNTKDCHLIWHTPQAYSDTPLADAQPLSQVPLEMWFKQYVIRIYNMDNSLRRTDYSKTPEYFYTHEKNYADGGEAFILAREFIVGVVAEDTAGNWSEVEARIIVSNPAPAALPAPTLNGFIGSFMAAWNPSPEVDVVGYVVHAVLGSDFTPGPTNLKNTGPETVFTYTKAAAGTWYVKIAAYDVFDKTGLNYSPAATIDVAGTIADIMTALEGSITRSQLLPALRTSIDTIDDPSTGLTVRLGAALTQIDSINGQLAGLTVSTYTASLTYAIGVLVRGTDGLTYKAKIAVPINTAPPNLTYWEPVVGVVSLAQAITDETTARQLADSNEISRVNALLATLQNTTVPGLIVTATNGSIKDAYVAADGALATDYNFKIASITQPVTGSIASAITASETVTTGLINTTANAVTTLQSRVDGIESLFGAYNSWNFDTTVEGFIAGGTGGSLAWVRDSGNGSLNYTTVAGGVSPTINITGLSVPSKNNVVRMKIKRISGTATDWVGSMMYSTAANPTPSLSRYKAAPSLVGGLPPGKDMVFEWDMSALTVGGTDWLTQPTITGLSIILAPNNTVGQFYIDWIVIGSKAPPASMAYLEDVRYTLAQVDIAEAGLRTTLAARVLNTEQLFDPIVTWNFLSSFEGWNRVATDVTLSVTSTGGKTTLNMATFTTNTVQIYVPTSGVDGTKYTLVRAKIKNTGSIDITRFQCYYANAVHATYTVSYYKNLVLTLKPGEESIVEWDMTALTAGGADWTNPANPINGIALGLGGIGATLEIDWITIGRKAPAASTAAIETEQSVRAQTVGKDYSATTAFPTKSICLYNGVLYRNTVVPARTLLGEPPPDAAKWTPVTSNAYAQYTLKLEVDAGGTKYVSGFGLSNDGETSDFIVVADKFAIMAPIADALITDPLKKKLIPFAVARVNNTWTVGINGQLVVDGSINARAIDVTSLHVGPGGISIDENALITFGQVMNAVPTLDPAIKDMLQQEIEPYLPSPVYSRASTAYYEGSAEIALVDTPRIVKTTHDGARVTGENAILMEPAATNWLAANLPTHLALTACTLNGGATLGSITPGQSDPFGGMNAVRYYVTSDGITSRRKFWLGGVVVPAGVNGCQQVWVRNRSITVITVTANIGLSSVSIPASSGWILVQHNNVLGDGVAQMHLDFATTLVGESIDVDLFRPMQDIVNTISYTSWTNSTRALDTLSVSAVNMGTKWSIECWAKSNTIGTINKWVFSSWTKFGVGIGGGSDTTKDGYPLFAYYDGTNTRQNVYASAPLAAPKGWNHWATTFDGTTVKVYVNGVVVIVVTTPLPQAWNSNAIQIGCGIYWAGYISKFRTLNFVMTPAQVTNAYQFAFVRGDFSGASLYELDFNNTSMWKQTSTGKLYSYNGVAWVLASTVGAPAGTLVGNKEATALALSVTLSETAISDLTSDDILSPVEKQALLTEWYNVYYEWANVLEPNAAAKLGTGHIAYTNYLGKIATLNAFINSAPVNILNKTVSTALSVTTLDGIVPPNVTGTVLRNFLWGFYQTRGALITALTDKAGTTALWSGIPTGTGKAADYATVGADATNLQVGLSSNMIVDADFRNWANHPLTLWNSITGLSAEAGINFGSIWRLPAPSNTPYLKHPNNIPPETAYSAFYTEYYTVASDSWYELYAYTGARRCKVQITVAEYNGAGAFNLSTTLSIINDGEAAGGVTLNVYKKTGGFFKTQGTTASIYITIAKFCTKTGQADSYLFLGPMYLGKALSAQVTSGVFSDWSPGPAGYAGQLNATNGAPTGTYVGGTEASALSTSAATSAASIGQMADDTILSPIEKQALLKEYYDVYYEWVNVLAPNAGTKIGTGATAYVDYSTKMSQLITFINSAAVNIGSVGTSTYLSTTTLAGVTPVTGNSFRSFFFDFYQKRAALYTALSDKAGTIADWDKLNGTMPANIVTGSGTEIASTWIYTGTLYAEKVSSRLGTYDELYVGGHVVSDPKQATGPATDTRAYQNYNAAGVMISSPRTHVDLGGQAIDHTIMAVLAIEIIGQSTFTWTGFLTGYTSVAGAKVIIELFRVDTYGGEALVKTFSTLDLTSGTHMIPVQYTDRATGGYLYRIKVKGTVGNMDVTGIPTLGCRANTCSIVVMTTKGGA